MIQSRKIREIQAAVKRRQLIQSPFPAQRKMQIVGVKVDNVKLVPVSGQLLKHQYVLRQVIPAIGIGSQRYRAARYQPCAGVRIAAGKERYSMSKTNQFLGQPRNHALGSTVSRRGNTFIEGRDLSNIHQFRVSIALSS